MQTTLFILSNPFKDEKISDEDFFCWQCLLLEGVVAKFPEKLKALVIERVEFPRPRQSVISLVGPDNQSLPTLVLGDDVLVGYETGVFGETRFVKGKDDILNALTEIYNIPRVHP